MSYWALLLAIFAGALAFRLPRLSERPMHADEAVQARITWRLWSEGSYAYDPDEFHGPTLPYAALPSLWIGQPDGFAGSDEADYRIVTVAFGAGMILLLGLLTRALPRLALVAAGLLAAVSPAMVFYSRYYIHETLLVFFSLAACGAGWRFMRDGKTRWCVATGVCIGLMQATKETAVFSYAAAAGAGFTIWAARRVFDRDASRNRPAPRRSALLIGLIAAVFTAMVFYTSFFTNLRGPWDGVLTYLPWADRAAGHSPHTQGPAYFFWRLAWRRVGDGPVWSEAAILVLAAIGMAWSWAPRRAADDADGPWFARWLSVYTIILALIYTVIPYKTPWCMLQMMLGMVLLAGAGAAALIQRPRYTAARALLALVVLAAAGQLAWQACRANYQMHSDPTLPYVVAPTLTDVRRLEDDLRQLAQAASSDRPATIVVIWDDSYYWPLPWCLRGFERVGYWTKMPERLDQAIVLHTPRYDPEVTARLEQTHLMVGYYGVRPNVLAQLWVEERLWEAHLRQLGNL